MQSFTFYYPSLFFVLLMVKVSNEILVKTNLKFITWSLNRQFLLTMPTPTRELQPGGGEIYHLSVTRLQRKTMKLTQISKELFPTLHIRQIRFRRKMSKV